MNPLLAFAAMVFNLLQGSPLARGFELALSAPCLITYKFEEGIKGLGSRP